MTHTRVERVAEEIRKEIGIIIQQETKDPRIGFITITKVELSHDLRFAKIFFSLLGNKKQLRDTQVGLERCKGFIRKLLSQRMKLRYTPELAFKLDQGIAHSIHISKILNEISKEEKT